MKRTGSGLSSGCALHFVSREVLDDHEWENRVYLADMVFLISDAGSLR